MLVISGGARSARATSGYYVGPDGGNWNTAANWSATSGGAGGVGVPGDGDFAVLDSTSNTTVNFDGSFTTGLSTFWVGSTSTGNPTLNISSGSLLYNNVSDFYGALIGKGGRGTVSLSGTGTFSMTGNEEIGFDNNGTFIQSGGNHTQDASHSMVLGRQIGSSGTYIMSGGTLSTGGYLAVGQDGNGTFIQTGGFANPLGDTFIGLGAAGTTASYTIGGGTLSTNFIGVGGEVYDASGSTAALTINNGGVVHVTANLSGPNTAYGVLRLFAGGTMTLNAGGSIDGSGVWNNGTININGGSFTFGSIVNVGLEASGTVNQTAGTVTIGSTLGPASLILGNYATGSNGFYSLGGTGSVGVTGTEIIGQYGGGTFVQSAGTNTLTSELHLADQYGGYGSYSLSGGSVTASGFEFVGYRGTAAFTQSGGTNNANAGLDMAADPAAIGTYNLSGVGTVLAVTGDDYVGDIGLAVASQGSGVTHTVSGSANIGYATGSRGVYNLNGGTYSVGGDLDIGGQGIGTAATFNVTGGSVTVTGTEGIGCNTGNATLTQSAGTNTAGQLAVGGSASWGGVVILSGGTLNGGVVENIGSSGSAIFSQTGGTHNTSEMFLTANVGATSTYMLSAGTLNVNVAGNPNNLSVGGTVGGTFIQNGGIVNVAGTLDLSHDPNSNSVYTLTAGTLTANTEYVGDSAVATFNQSGGSNTSTFIDVGAFAASTGTYNLSAGTLTATGGLQGYLFVGDGNNGTFNQSGGSVSATLLLVGRTASANGLYRLSNGSLTATNEGIGGFDTGIFTQTGGTNTAVNALNVGSGSGPGNYNMQGGSLVTAAVNVQATLSQSGGTISSSGATQIYSGGSYSISAGSTTTAGLFVGGTTASASGAGQLTISGGSLTSTAASTVYSTGTVSLSAGVLSLQNTATISGSLTGSAGTLAIGGGGSSPNVTINGAASNAFTGFTAINSGTLTLNNSSGTAIGGTITIGNGVSSASLSLSGDNQTDNKTVLVLDSNGTLSMNGHVSTVAEWLSLTSTATTTPSGLTATSGTGLLLIDGQNQSSSATLSNSLRYVTTGGLSGATISGNLTLPLGNHVVALSRNNNAINDLTISSVITGSGGIIQAGPGVLLFSGSSANTYTGSTTITQGTLKLGKTAGVNAIAGNLVVAGGTVMLAASNQIADSSTVNIYSGGTVNLNGNSETFAAVTGDGTLTISSGTLNLGGDNSSSTFSGSINGGGSFNKNGTGTLALNGSNGWSGQLTVNAGVVQLGNSLALSNSNSAAIVQLGARIDLNGQQLGVNSTGLSIRGTGPDGNGVLINSAAGTIAKLGGHAVTLAADATIGGPGEIDISTVVNGTGVLTKAGTGTLLLSGSNPFTGGFNINSGTVQFVTINSLGTGTVTLNGGTLQAMMSSQTVGGAPIALGTGGGTMSAGNSNLWFYNNAISGSGPLTIDTPFTILFDGSAVNTYTGNTTVKHGTLSIFRTGAGSLVIPAGLTIGDGTNLATLQSGSDNAISSTSAVTLNHNGTLDLQNSNQSIGSLSGADGTVMLGSPSVGAGKLTVGGNNASTTYAGVITGNGSLTKTGSGTLTLMGKNDFTGSVTINSGTLAFNVPSNLGIGTNITLAGGTLAPTGTASLSRTIGVTGDSAMSVSSGNTLTLTGALVASNALTKTGAGTLALTAASPSYSGTMQISAGTVSIANPNALTGGTTKLVVLDGGTFQSTTSLTLNRTISLTSNGGNIDTAPGIVLNSGPITGSGGFTKTGPGTLSLGGSSSYAGTTTVAAGMLSLASDGAFTANNAVVVNAGATFDVSNATAPAVGSITGLGTVVVGSSVPLTLTGAANTTFAGVISGGAGGIDKTGTGIMTLSGVSTYSGETDVHGGTLTFGIANALPVTTPLDVNTATVDLNGLPQTVQWLIRGTNGVITNTGAPTTFTISMPGGGHAPTSSAAITGAISLVVNCVNNNDTQELFGNSTFTGSTTINNGSLYMGVSNALPTTTDLSIAAGGNLNLGGNLQTIASLAGTGSVVLSSGTLTINGSASTTYGGNIVDLNNGGAIVQSGTGILTLTGTNTYTGPTTINAGTVSVSADTNLGNGGALVLGLAGTLATTASFTSSRSVTASGGSFNVAAGTTLTLAGAMSGFGGFTANGPGTLVLAGFNTFSGVVSVQNGTLLAAATAALPNSVDLALAPGGTIDLGSTSPAGTPKSFASISGAGGTLIVTPGGEVDIGNGNSSTVFGGVITGNLATFRKIGTGTLTLGGHNSYTGSTIISGGMIKLGISDALPTSTTFTNDAGSLDLNGLNQHAAGPVNIVNSGAGASTFTINGVSSATSMFTGTVGGNVAVVYSNSPSTGRWVFSGNDTFSGGLAVNTGTLELSGARNFTGGVTINTGGTLQADADNSLGSTIGNPITLAGGTLAAGGSFTTSRNLALANGLGGSISVPALTTLTYAGNISGSSTLTKTGTGAMLINAAQALSGPVVVGGGTLSLTGNSGTMNSASLVNLGLGGTLVLDNHTAGNATSPAGRISDSTPLVLNGGTFSFVGADNTASSETLGALIPNSGASSVQLTNGSSGTATVTFSGGLGTRGAGATVNFAAADLDAASPANKIVLTGYTPGSNPILGGWATASTTIVPAAFAKYDATKGIIPLAAGDYSPTGNVRYTANATVPNNSTFDTLTLDTTGGSFNVTQNAGSVLTLAKGGLLKVGSPTATITGGDLAASSSYGEIDAYVAAGTLNIFSRLVDPTAGGTTSLVKSGVGTLVLGNGAFDTVANTFTGTTYIEQGELDLNKAGGAGAFAIQGPVVVSGGTLKQLQPNQINPNAGVTITTGSYDSNAQNASFSFLTNQGGTATISSTVTVQNATFADGLSHVTNGGVLIIGPSGGGGGGGNGTGSGGGISNTTPLPLLQVSAASTIVDAGGQVQVNGNILFTGGNSPTYTLTSSASATSPAPGLLKLTSAVASGNDLNVTAPTATLASGGNAQFAGTFDLGGVNNRGFSIASGCTLTVSAAIANGGFELTGGGTLILQTANSYAGGTKITNGTLQVSSPSQLGGGTINFNGNNGTLALRSDATPLTFTQPLTSSAAVSTNIDVGPLNPNAGTSVAFTMGSTLPLGVALNATGTAGDSLTLGGLTLLNTSTSNPTAIHNAVDVTINGAITQIGSNGDLQKDGAGTLTFAGSGALSYTGTTTVAGGTLVLSKSTSNTIAHDLSVLNGAVVRLGTANQIASSSHVTLNGAAGNSTLDLANFTNTFSASPYAISFTAGGTLTTAAAGRATLGSDIEMTGASGTAFISGNLDLGSAGRTFNLSGSSALLMNLAATVTGTIPNGTVALTKSGPGTLALTGNNSFGGNNNSISVTAGVLQITADANLGAASNSLSLSNAATNAELQANGSFTSNRNIALGSGGGAIDVTTPNTLTLGGVISGSAGLTKAGLGTLVLAGVSNTFTGNVTINGGILEVAADSSLGNAANQIILNGGQLIPLNSQVTINRQITFGVGGATIDAETNSPVTLSSAVGGGGLTKTGPGVLTINGTQNWNSGALLNDTAGTVNLNTSAGSSVLSLRVGSGATTNLNNVGQSLAAITLDSGGALIDTGGTLTSSGALTLVNSGGQINAAQPIVINGSAPTTWSGTLLKTGASSLDINRTGGVVTVPVAGATLNISQGTFNAGGSVDPFTDSSVSNRHVAVVNSGTFNVTAGTKGVASISGNGSTSVSSGATLNVGSSPGSIGQTSLTISGTLATNGGSGSSYGPVTLSGSGATTLSLPASGGNAQFGDLTFTGVEAGVTVAAGATLAVNSIHGGSLSTGGNVTIRAGASPDTVNSVTGLTITGGHLDLTNNQLLASATTTTAVKSALAAEQLLTSTAGGALGYGDLGNGTIEIRFTLLGDSDLNGNVNVADLANLAGNFGKTSGQLWISGDFDYNGNVNVADLADLAGNFGGTLPGLGSAAIISAAPPSAILAEASAASVPEPSLSGLFAVAGAGAWARRCRRHRRCN
jgi:autotransporter-associated beta strand protein